MTKKPNRKKNPPKPGQVRRAIQPQGTNTETIVWHIGIIDTEGEWGWRKLESKTFWEIIHESIKNFETMTWSQIKGHQSHLVKVSNLCSEAQKRLVDINQDDTDELFSLRLSGIKRIWGIPDGRVFKVLWWDPYHTVCPTKQNYHKYLIP